MQDGGLGVWSRDYLVNSQQWWVGVQLRRSLLKQLLPDRGLQC